MRTEDLARITVTVDLWVTTTNYQEIVSEMDYNFIHPSILDMEIVDINYE